MSSAEEGLMALLEAMLTLAARETRRPKPPAVKPGGHPEEHFTDLTEDEKEEFTCSIWYGTEFTFVSHGVHKQLKVFLIYAKSISSC